MRDVPLRCSDQSVLFETPNCYYAEFGTWTVLSLCSSGLCQPSTSVAKRSASRGPHEPGRYGCKFVALARMGSTIAQAASTASSRTNNMASPCMASQKEAHRHQTSPRGVSSLPEV